MEKMVNLAKSVVNEYPIVPDLIIEIDHLLDKIFIEKPADRVKSRI